MQKSVFRKTIEIVIFAIFIFFLQLLGKRFSKVKQQSSEPNSTSEKQKIIQGEKFILDAPKTILALSGIFVCLVALAFILLLIILKAFSCWPFDKS